MVSDHTIQVTFAKSKSYKLRITLVSIARMFETSLNFLAKASPTPRAFMYFFLVFLHPFLRVAHM